MREFIDTYLDGELAADNTGEFRSWLRENEDHVAEMVFASCIHSHLVDLYAERAVQADALAFTQQSPCPPAAGTGVRKNVPGSPPLQRRLVSWRGGILLAAAALLLPAAILYWPWVRPPVVAMVSQVSGAAWYDDAEAIAVGTLLKSGQSFRLKEGTLQLTYVSGAKVALQGPAEFALLSTNAGHLKRGAITAAVPTEAIGFRIESPIASLVDLGTEFTLEITGDVEFELYVLDGLVEVQLAAPAGLPNRPVRVSQGRAVRVNKSDNSVKIIPYDAARRIEVETP